MSVKRTIALIGGGRWARVLAGVALEAMEKTEGMVLCSPSNPEAWEGWSTERCKVVGCLEEALEDPEVTKVVIARKARDHAETAKACLKRGQEVLVEKPFAVTLDQAESLLGMGGKAATGLVFRYASNLERFAEACGEVQSLKIAWEDPKGEVRHGEKKGFDPDLAMEWDVMPHVWSIAERLVGGRGWQLIKAHGSGGGDVQALFDVRGRRVEVDLKRGASQRVRRLQVKGSWGKGEIDFAREPGQAHLNGREIDVKEGWDSPLKRQLQAFARGGVDGLDPVTRLENAVEALKLADQISEASRRGQAG